MNFKILKTGVNNNTLELEKASATVIKAGDFVALDAGGLAIVALATSTAVAFCETGALAGSTTVIVDNDKELILSGTGSTTFTKAKRGTTANITSAGGVQTINLAANTLNIVSILPSLDAGTVGSTADIQVRINKSL